MKTMTRRNMLTLLCGAAVTTLLFAAPAPADELDDLKERFRERAGELLTLKNDGKVGETYLGYVEAVKDTNLSPAAQKIVDAENKDRKRLYQIIAEQQKTTAERVAERNALRNFSQARKGHWLKTKDGWMRK